MRKLKLLEHETDPKCNTSIRASSLAVEHIQAMRQALIAHMVLKPEQQTPLFPSDVNSDLVIRMLCRIVARDYGIPLNVKEE